MGTKMSEAWPCSQETGTQGDCCWGDEEDASHLQVRVSSAANAAPDALVLLLMELSRLRAKTAKDSTLLHNAKG